MGRWGRVRDRMAHAAVRAAMGVTIFMCTAGEAAPRTQKWWGPVVLDASRDLPISLGIL